MQPINQIIKEIGLPVWICWGTSLFAIGTIVFSSIRSQGVEVKPLFSSLPIPAITVLLLTMGMIFYFTNSSLKRRKEHEQSTALWKGQLAAMHSSPLIKEEKTITLDPRLQSLDGIIGYLDQSIKMEQEPKNLAPIILTLARDIKNVRDGQ